MKYLFRGIFYVIAINRCKFSGIHVYQVCVCVCVCVDTVDFEIVELLVELNKTMPRLLRKTLLTFLSAIKHKNTGEPSSYVWRCVCVCVCRLEADQSRQQQP